MNNLFYQDLGSGRNLVLLHGYCEHSGVWESLIPALSHDFRLLIPDLPGFGKSEPLKTTTLETVAQSLSDWLKDMEVDHCTIIGHSLGGYIALAIEELFPGQTISFGLFHSTATADSEEKKKTRTAVKEFIHNHGQSKFIDGLAPALFKSSNLKKSYFNDFLNIAGQSAPESIIDYAIAMRDRPDRQHILHQGNKKVLFIAGKHDAAVPFGISEKQARSRDHIEFVPLENSGHMGMYEEPETCIKAIRGFIT